MTRRPLTLPSPPPGARGFADPYDPARAKKLLAEAGGDAPQIQKVLHDRTVFASIWENGFIRGVGPRVEEPALALIPFYPYSAPYEDLRLKP
jgi:ABC-type transport system substrate-binding protein